MAHLLQTTWVLKFAPVSYREMDLCLAILIAHLCTVLYTGGSLWDFLSMRPHICPHVFFSSASFAFESLFNQNFHNNFFPLLQQGTYSMYVDRGRGCGVAATIHLALLYSLGRGKPSNSKTASMNIQRAGCGGDISVVSVK